MTASHEPCPSSRRTWSSWEFTFRSDIGWMKWWKPAFRF